MKDLIGVVKGKIQTGDVEYNSWTYETSISQWLIQIKVIKVIQSWERVIINGDTFNIEAVIGNEPDTEYIRCDSVAVLTRTKYEGKEVTIEPARYNKRILSSRKRNNSKIIYDGVVLDERVRISCHEFHDELSMVSGSEEERIIGLLCEIKYMIDSYEKDSIEDVEKFLRYREEKTRLGIC